MAEQAPATKSTKSTKSTKKPRHDGFTPYRQAAFLKRYRDTGNIRLSCEAAHINRTTYYEYYNEDGPQHDPAFKAAVDAADEEYTDLLEATARQFVLVDRKEMSLWKLLASRRRDKYGDQRDINLRGALTVLSVEQVVAAAKKAEMLEAALVAASIDIDESIDDSSRDDTDDTDSEG